MPWMGRPVVVWMLLAPAFGAVGCGGGSDAVPYPPLDAAGAVGRLFAHVDGDKSGFLERAELVKAPSLLNALAAWDRDGDGKISRSEATARFQLHVDACSPLVQPPARVTFGGTPVSGVEVKLVPEPFMGPGFLPATGATDRNGFASFYTPGEPLAGVRCGLYRIEASRKVGDKETLPPRCNVQTVYGVDLQFASSQGIQIDLK